jgi:hypothetical protein
MWQSFYCEATRQWSTREISTVDRLFLLELRGTSLGVRDVAKSWRNKGAGHAKAAEQSI